MGIFSKNLKYLRDKKGLKGAEIETLTGFKRTTWSNYENDKSFPDFNDLIKIAKFFNVTETELIHVKLFEHKETIKHKPKSIYEFDNSIVSEPTTNYNEGNIYLLDSKAAAGLPYNINNNGFYNSLPKFRLPIISTRIGEFICLEVTGDSMHPTIKDREWLIGERVMNYTDIKSGYVYIIVNTEGVCCKRVYHEGSKPYIKLVSDNETYSPYKEPLDGVIAIYKSVLKISHDFRNWNIDVRKDLDDLKSKFSQLEVRIDSFLPKK